MRHEISRRFLLQCVNKPTKMQCEPSFIVYREYIIYNVCNVHFWYPKNDSSWYHARTWNRLCFQEYWGNVSTSRLIQMDLHVSNEMPQYHQVKKWKIRQLRHYISSSKVSLRCWHATKNLRRLLFLSDCDPLRAYEVSAICKWAAKVIKIDKK